MSWDGIESTRLTGDSTETIESLLASILEEIRGMRDEARARAGEMPLDRDEYGNLK
jgi:hypothetical protein